MVVPSGVEEVIKQQEEVDTNEVEVLKQQKFELVSSSVDEVIKQQESGNMLLVPDSAKEIIKKKELRKKFLVLNREDDVIMEKKCAGESGLVLTDVGELIEPHESEDKVKKLQERKSVCKILEYLEQG